MQNLRVFAYIARRYNYANESTELKSEVASNFFKACQKKQGMRFITC